MLADNVWKYKNALLVLFVCNNKVVQRMNLNCYHNYNLPNGMKDTGVVSVIKCSYNDLN